MPQSTAAFKGSLHRIARLGLTAAIIAAAVIAVLAGRAVLSERALASVSPEAVAPQAVLTARIEFEEQYAVERAFTGQIRPAQRTDLAFELGGTLSEILVDEGDAVAAGDVIASLETSLLETERTRLLASREAVAAQAELAARTDRRQSALQARGFASTQASDAASLGLAELNARIAEIDAGLMAIDVRLEKATIRAPFAGRIAARHLDEGGNAGAGQPVVSLVETSDPVFQVGLAPEALRSVPSGEPVAIRFNGDEVEAQLRAVLPELDAATRTRTVLFTLSGDDLPAYRGTGMLVLSERVGARGAWVPVSALEDGPRGLWRILTVIPGEDGFVVGSETIEILHATAEQAFVRGTVREGTRFITDGTHRVVPGQLVRPIADAG
jgi:RND family efflux transporter MFP subunit